MYSLNTWIETMKSTSSRSLITRRFQLDLGTLIRAAILVAITVVAPIIILEAAFRE